MRYLSYYFTFYVFLGAIRGDSFRVILVSDNTNVAIRIFRLAGLSLSLFYFLSRLLLFPAARNAFPRVAITKCEVHGNYIALYLASTSLIHLVAHYPPFFFSSSPFFSLLPPFSPFLSLFLSLSFFFYKREGECLLFLT